MLQIKLGAERVSVDDELGRDRVGWWPEMTEDEAWTAGRGVWKLRADRALAQAEVQIISPEDIVLAVATITGVSKHGSKFAVEGDLLRGDPRVGSPTPSPNTSLNPVAYISDARAMLGAQSLPK
jgi:hypothetical protein